MKVVKLAKLYPCSDALDWVAKRKNAKEAWQNCERGDWMLWLLGKLCKTLPQRKKLVLATCACVRPALQYVKAGEERPLKTIETAEAWAKGDTRITLQMVRDAAAAAAAAADAAYAAAAAAAAYAAADAAYAAAAAAREKSLKQSADIVRDFYPNPPRLP